ncbi:putative MarR family transcriptional regulator [Gordonia effusa NBRC 100432]|uniref:Putative MarR family transcriptional regulator n=1 Tax=Gordonia effusa NBRC 100432 TaxID=1077974 RepID=H0QXT0_9ACTN|nr:MarR family winged helix-turn-helix transcriptional regulator [Gordonia effusa]GAB17631.1 putative MarR family transcriptional regulator [Gordonia effusa NBRC 100432]
MVDYNDNPVVYQDFGGELAFALMGAFRTFVDEAHELLAEGGFEDARPIHGFTLQAIGSGRTAAQLADRLGVTKQAVAKTIARLEEGGYVTRTVDSADSRRKVITPTARGQAFLAASAHAFDKVVGRWQIRAGTDEVNKLLTTLRIIVSGKPIPLDLAAWSE